MSNYYARYVAGDCEAVWRELVDHGEAVRDPSIWPDTVSVASELVDRAYRNLRLLWKRLVELATYSNIPAMPLWRLLLGIWQPWIPLSQGWESCQSWCESGTRE